MAASRQDVDRWIESAKQKKFKFILSVCDTFGYDDYPVNFKTLKDLKEGYQQYDGTNMQRINEVIRINDDGSVDENLNIHNL